MHDYLWVCSSGQRGSFTLQLLPSESCLLLVVVVVVVDCDESGLCAHCKGTSVVFFFCSVSVFIKRKCTLTSLSPPGFKSFPLFWVEMRLLQLKEWHNSAACEWHLGRNWWLFFISRLAAGGASPFSGLCCTVDVQLLLAAVWDSDRGGKRRRGKAEFLFVRAQQI